MAPPILPTFKGFTYPVKRTPMARTLRQEAVSGQDNPIQLWTYPRWQYELPISVLNSGATAFQSLSAIEMQTLAAFWNTVMFGSSGLVFQFTDPDDGTVTDQSFGSGDGVTVAFPLVRTMTGTGFTFVEPVFAPTITNVKISGTPTAAYTLGTQGLVTFNSAPAAAAPLTWTGTFRWLVRFDDDSLEFSKFMNNLWECKALKFTSIKTRSM